VLLGQPVEALKELATSLGERPFRGQQVYDALMATARNPAARGARSVAEIQGIPQV
jgi:hypothetical protein